MGTPTQNSSGGENVDRPTHPCSADKDSDRPYEGRYAYGDEISGRPAGLVGEVVAVIALCTAIAIIILFIRSVIAGHGDAGRRVLGAPPAAESATVIADTSATTPALLPSPAPQSQLTQPFVPGPTRITLQFEEPADRGVALAVRKALKQHDGWRVGPPEHVLPEGENKPETYGGVRYFFEGDSVLAREVCTEVQAELARHEYSVVMPIWPMLTRQRLGLFHARPGLIEVWISPLPPAAPEGTSVSPGQCGR